jgi:hypothetical protein
MLSSDWNAAWRVSTVKAEHKPLEAGLRMGTAQAVVDVQGPDFEVGDDAVDPGRTTCAAILPMHADRERRPEQRVSGPSLGFGGRARPKVAGDERMQTVGRVVGHLAETDPAGTTILDRTDDDDLALVAASDTTRYRTILTAAGDLGLIDLHQTGERIAVRCHHAVAQLGVDQPTRFVRAESERALELQVPRCRWNGSPSDRPPRSWWPAAAWNGARWCRFIEVC